MVARRHDIDTHIANGIPNFAGDAHTASRVLHIGDHDVDGVLLGEDGQRAAEALSPGLAHDVTDEENLHVLMIAQAPVRSEPVAHDGC